MPLSFVFRRHAELCTKMARSANSIEVRDQWIGLGKQWQQKAEADELLTASASDGAEPLPRPSLPPVQIDAPLQQQPQRLDSSGPALVPVQALVTAERDKPLAPPITAGDVDGMDDLWSEVIVDIRTKHTR